MKNFETTFPVYLIVENIINIVSAVQPVSNCEIYKNLSNQYKAIFTNSDNLKLIISFAQIYVEQCIAKKTTADILSDATITDKLMLTLEMNQYRIRVFYFLYDQIVKKNLTCNESQTLTEKLFTYALETSTAIIQLFELNQLPKETCFEQFQSLKSYYTLLSQHFDYRHHKKHKQKVADAQNNNTLIDFLKTEIGYTKILLLVGKIEPATEQLKITKNVLKTWKSILTKENYALLNQHLEAVHFPTKLK